MNITLSLEKRKTETYVRFRIKNHELMWAGSDILLAIGPSLIDSNRVIFDFSEVSNANSSVLDTIVKIIKKDKKNHSYFIFSNQMLNIINLCGLHKILRIID